MLVQCFELLGRCFTNFHYYHHHHHHHHHRQEYPSTHCPSFHLLSAFFLQTLTPPKTAVSTMVENVVAALLKKEPKGSPAPASGVPTASTDTTHNGFDDNEDDSGDMPLISASFSGSAERHINPERDNYNVDKITYCWKCGDQFNSRKLLVRHLKEHNIDLPFKCYLCDASYDSRLECLLHQEKHHGSDWAILKVTCSC